MCCNITKKIARYTFVHSFATLPAKLSLLDKTLRFGKGFAKLILLETFDYTVVVNKVLKVIKYYLPCVILRYSASNDIYINKFLHYGGK